MGNGFLLWQNGGGGGSLPVTETTEYELLADIEVTGSATTNVYINGLNIGKGDEVVLVGLIYNPTASDSSYYIYANSNTVTTNYYVQALDANGTMLSDTARVNAPTYIYGTANQTTLSEANIKLTNSGYFICQSNISRQVGATSAFLCNYYITSTFTTSAITSLQITSSVASAIGIGSRFQLYRATGEVTQTWATT